MHNLNPLVVFIAAMSTYVVAGIWYSPALFGRIWHWESRDPRPYSPGQPYQILFTGFLFSMVVVIAFGNALGSDPAIGYAIETGFYAGFCFVATSFGIHYQFTKLSVKLWLIDGGFRVVQFAVFGWLLAWLGLAGLDSRVPMIPILHGLVVYPFEPAKGYNVAAILIAAVSGLLLGRLWYSPILFGKVWLRLDAGRQQLRSGQPWRIFGVGLIFSLIAAAAFANWVGPHSSLPFALEQGLLVGTFLVAGSYAINYLCANHGWRMCLIDGGYHSAQFLVYGLVLGLMG